MLARSGVPEVAAATCRAGSNTKVEGTVNSGDVSRK